MSLLSRLFHKRPPDGLLEVADRVYVFDSCFSTEVLPDEIYQMYLYEIINELHEAFPHCSVLAFNFREGQKQSQFAELLCQYDAIVIDYPRQYEGCPVLPLSLIHHFLRVSNSWLLRRSQSNIVLLHSERGGWPLLAFVLASFLIFRKLHNGERRTLEMVHREAPKGFLKLLSPLNPLPSQLRYLQYVARRNISSEWPPPEQTLSLDCLILRGVPGYDNHSGCRPIIRIFGRNQDSKGGLSTQMLFSMSKKKKNARQYQQGDCDVIKIDIRCLVQGDVVLECVHLDLDPEREVMMFRVMFNTAFIRSNILILNCENLDILWDSKDRFPRGFRTEVLFGEVQSSSPTREPIMTILDGEVRGGLPIEAFSKVQELFSGVEWVDNSDDAALWLLKQLSVLHSRVSSHTSPVDSEDASSTTDSFEFLEPESARSRQMNFLDDYLSQDSASDEASDVVSNPFGDAFKHIIVDNVESVIAHPEKVTLEEVDTCTIPEDFSEVGIATSLEGQSLLEHEENSPSPDSPPPYFQLVVNSSCGLSVPPTSPTSASLSLQLATTTGYKNCSTSPSCTDGLDPSALSVPVLSNQGASSPSLRPPPPPPPPPPLPSSFCKDSLQSLPPLMVCHTSSQSSLCSPPQTSPSLSLPPQPLGVTAKLTPPPPSPILPEGIGLAHRTSPPHPPPPPPPPPPLLQPPGMVNKKGPPPPPAPPPPPSRAPPPPPPLLQVNINHKAPSLSLPQVEVNNKGPPPPPPPLPPPTQMKSNSKGPSPPLPSSPPPLQVKVNFQGPPPPPPPPPPVLLARDKASTLSAPPRPPPPPPPPLAPRSQSSIQSSSHSSKPPTAPPPPPLSTRGSAPGPPPPPAPKCSGAPPPPPLSSGKGKASSGITSNGRGRAPTSMIAAPKKMSLKPLHWVKVTRAMQGSLWDDTQKQENQSGAPEIDITELESLFSSSTEASGNAKTGIRLGSNTKKPEKVQLVDLRRAYNCEIMLTKIKIPLPEMMKTVLALDSSSLDIDQVENLIKFCPTKEEMELLKNYNGDREMLGKCEQFFLELMKVPRVESKLRVFAFKINFTTQVNDLRCNLHTINDASQEVRESIKLRQIMQTILTLGNALNQGTARGSAVGFKLDSLLKLSDTRARNNKMTLMHYLCKLLAEKIPELLDFDKDLVHLEAASKIQLKTLAEEMQAVSKGLEKVEQELATSESDGVISAGFRKALKVFLDSAEAEVRSLTSLYSEVGRNADSLSLYFGEDPARCPFEQVTQILAVFVKMFNKSRDENGQQAEAERKRLEKEAMKEKASAANSALNLKRDHHR
ncbi:Formin-like protein 14 [Dionaea muscipula]